MHLISTKVKDSLQISHKHHAECLKIKQLPDLYLFLLFDLIMKLIKTSYNWPLVKIDTHISHPMFPSLQTAVSKIKNGSPFGTSVF